MFDSTGLIFFSICPSNTFILCSETTKPHFLHLLCWASFCLCCRRKGCEHVCPDRLGQLRQYRLRKVIKTCYFCNPRKRNQTRSTKNVQSFSAYINMGPSLFPLSVWGNLSAFPLHLIPFLCWKMMKWLWFSDNHKNLTFDEYKVKTFCSVSTESSAACDTNAGRCGLNSVRRQRVTYGGF